MNADELKKLLMFLCETANVHDHYEIECKPMIEQILSAFEKKSKAVPQDFNKKSTTDELKRMLDELLSYDKTKVNWLSMVDPIKQQILDAFENLEKQIEQLKDEIVEITELNEP